MSNKQLTDLDNKTILKKIGVLEKELHKLKSQIQAKEQNERKFSSSKRKRLQIDLNHERCASKKTNYETSPCAEGERPKTIKCFSKNSARSDCLEGTARVPASESKSRPQTKPDIRRRTQSKDLDVKTVAKKKKPFGCKTCLRLMNKGYPTKFCPKHGNYPKGPF